MNTTINTAEQHHPNHPPISNLNGGWMYHPETMRYSTEASESNHRDPWGSALPVIMATHRNAENEIQYWAAVTTTPNGQMASLMIFND